MRTVRGVLCIGAVVALAVTISSVGPPAPVKMARVIGRRHGPIRIHQQRDNSSWDSYNWSGYSVTGASGAVTVVNGSWIVPSVTCSQAPTGYSSFWVGIDGFSSGTVEQIGTDSDCVSLKGKSNTPTYYAWFEFYPNPSYLIVFPRGVQPGDQITANVTYNGTTTGNGHRPGGSQFTVTLTDVTQGETYSTTSAVNSAKESSAEWIAEAPCCSKGSTVLPLADFGTALFSAGTATVSNVPGAIGSFGAAVQSVTMVGEYSPYPVKAQPYPLTNSGLTNSGSNFSVAWVSAGP